MPDLDPHVLLALALTTTRVAAAVGASSVACLVKVRHRVAVSAVVAATAAAQHAANLVKARCFLGRRSSSHRVQVVLADNLGLGRWVSVGSELLGLKALLIALITTALNNRISTILIKKCLL